MAKSDPPKRRHPNADEKRALKAANLHRFVTQYGRKTPKHGEPNDRRHDLEAVKIVERLKPEELDGLLRDDEE
jgi:hypothetical protein